MWPIDQWPFRNLQDLYDTSRWVMYMKECLCMYTYCKDQRNRTTNQATSMAIQSAGKTIIGCHLGPISELIRRNWQLKMTDLAYSYTPDIYTVIYMAEPTKLHLWIMETQTSWCICTFRSEPLWFVGASYPHRGENSIYNERMRRLSWVLAAWACRFVECYMHWRMI